MKVEVEVVGNTIPVRYRWSTVVWGRMIQWCVLCRDFVSWEILQLPSRDIVNVESCLVNECGGLFRWGSSFRPCGNAI